jgi:hypothetical protein
VKLFCSAWILLAAWIPLSLVANAHAELVAFPGAEGFGALATGGRGGEVYIVTNLDDSGPGSLRDAVSQPNRTVVFEVGGTITIESQLVFSSNLTVAGQTAPGGIAVFGEGVSLSGKNNVIVQYMTFRQGIESPNGRKTVNITDGHNIILDHISMSWGRWDNFGATNKASDITVQRCIISEAIDPQRLGGLIDSSTNITVANNLWIDNQSRNPKGKANMQYINNVVYNWGSNGYVGGHSGAPWKQDLINNYFIAGPSSSIKSMLSQFSATDTIYQTGNMADTDRDGALNGRLVERSDFRGNHSDEAPTFVDAIQNEPSVPVTIRSPQEAFEQILKSAGNSLHRDSVDERVIAQVKSLGTEGAIIHNESEVGGPATIVGDEPPMDTSRDGVPDKFQAEHGFAVDKVVHNIDSGDGYTWLEKYLHSLSGTKAE